MPDSPITTVETIVHSIIFDVALNAIKAEAYTQAPWLKLPIVNSIFSYFLNYFANQINTALSRFVSFNIIEAQIDHQNSEYKISIGDLKSAIQSGDTHAISKATDAVKSKLGALIGFGSTSS